MRMRSPASRGSFRLRFSVFDTIWAAASPVLAIFFRDGDLFSPDRINVTLIYCLISFGFSLGAFLLFRIRDGMADYFSVHDALDVARAVAVAELLTILILFTVTRLEGIPRSTPIIHALILAAGLVFVRTVVRMRKRERRPSPSQLSVVADHIIMIGSTPLTSLYIKLVEACSPHTRKVIAILDDNSQLVGRSVERTPIMGSPLHLEAIINEFTDHGIHTDRVVVGGEPNMLSRELLDHLERICEEHEIQIDFVPNMVGLNELLNEPTEAAMPAPPEGVFDKSSQFFRAKRIIDLTASLLLLTMLLPLFLLVSIIVLIDVGSPVFFWQQRVGMRGQSFLLHKFRTLKTSYDWQGHPVPQFERLSWVGTFLRKLRLDELPQLLNVIVGDMSLVGPRPLLIRDQPEDPRVRLSVRPGITGWAQINGGKLLSASEKNDLDEWYIHNASFWLDAKICVLTLLVMFRGERRAVTPAEVNTTSPERENLPIQRPAGSEGA